MFDEVKKPQKKKPPSPAQAQAQPPRVLEQEPPPADIALNYFGPGSNATQTATPPHFPGVGVELETQDVMFSISELHSDDAKEETFWKGYPLLNFACEHGGWAVTVETTTFNGRIGGPDDKKEQFCAEIVVDGIQTKLIPNVRVLQEVGQNILDTVRACGCITHEQSYDVKGETITGQGNLTKDTNVFLQITCAFPLSTVYDLLFSHSPLNDTYPPDPDPLQEQDSQGESPKKRKEVLAFEALLDSIFRGGQHDPKQNMSIMPRTSMGKIFSMLDAKQREMILAYIQNGLEQVTLTGQVGDSSPVDVYKFGQCLLAIHDRLKNGSSPIDPERGFVLDPIAEHPEPLGIGKLLDATETDLEGNGSYPIFEFRRIGACTLAQLPDMLDKIHEEIMARLGYTLLEEKKEEGGGEAAAAAVH